MNMLADRVFTVVIEFTTHARTAASVLQALQPVSAEVERSLRATVCKVTVTESERKGGAA